MNSEERLLIELMKGSKEKTLYKKVNWKKFIGLCSYHRIIHFAIQKLNARNVPDETIKELKEINKWIASKNLVLNKELLLLSKELEKKSIPFIVFKGMALNNLIYFKSFSRISSDIDVLIKEKDYEKIKSVLEKKGYSWSSYGLWKGKTHLQHFPIIKKKLNELTVGFEFHRELFFPENCFSIDLNEFWKNSKKINSINVPSNEDSIIIAVLSSVYHNNFHGIIEALIDVKNILPKGVNETKLKEKTIKYNAVEPMIYFNELLKEVFGLEVKEITKLEKVSDKRKLEYLRKNNLPKILEVKKGFARDLDEMKNMLYWTKNFKQKISTVLYLSVMRRIWKIKEFKLSAD